MNALTFKAAEFSALFGDNYAEPPGISPGVMLPLNALHSCAEELNVLSIASSEDHRDFEITLIRLARRMEIAAEIGHKEMLSLLEHVQWLETKVRKHEAAE